jgi:putative PIN family toxin of toxin-antitoxin system
MRVFFDASVIIAALLSPTGGSSLLLRFIKTQTIVGITSQTVIDEVLEQESKLNKTQGEIANLIAASGLVIRELVTLDEIRPYENLIDKEDAHLIAGAKRTKCTYLVSLDKRHVLRDEVRARFLPLKIVTPKELLRELVSQSGLG